MDYRRIYFQNNFWRE